MHGITHSRRMLRAVYSWHHIIRSTVQIGMISRITTIRSNRDDCASHSPCVESRYYELYSHATKIGILLRSATEALSCGMIRRSA